MVEKVKCKSKGCVNFILLETASKTYGYCMPCVQENVRQERKRYIAENCVEIDPFFDIKDRAEIIWINHTERNFDPLIRYAPFQGSFDELYGEITSSDEEWLINLSIQEAEKGNLHYVETVCLELAAFRSSDLSKLHEFMLQNNLYSPGMLFKDARLDVVNMLLSRLEGDVKNINKILLAIAWSRGDKVVEAFFSWLRDPPAWSRNLYLPVHEYSKEAGWEVVSEMEVRKLYFDQCFPLLFVDREQSDFAFQSCTNSGSECEWCGNRLTNFLELDLKRKQFSFLGITGERLNFVACASCVCYAEYLYMDVSFYGDAAWSSANVKPSCIPFCLDDYEPLPENRLALSSKERSACYAANEFLTTTFSQIGGMPTWIQDFAYPKCPTCKETMVFVAQICNEEIDKLSEGIYYMFICRMCAVSAVGYQQT